MRRLIRNKTGGVSPELRAITSFDLNIPFSNEAFG
jgi:hypothetical protein